jgi:hypothetical protein
MFIVPVFSTSSISACNLLNYNPDLLNDQKVVDRSGRAV